MKLSPYEARIYKILTRRPSLKSGGKINTEELLKLVYPEGVPMNGRAIMRVALDRLMAKSVHMDLPHKVVGTENTGRKAREVWLVQ